MKDEDVFASTTMTASVRMVLSQATDLRSEEYTVFTADVKTAFLNAHMKDGDMVYARPPPEWQPETLDPSKGTLISKLQKSLYGLRSAPRRWQDHLEEILRKCGFVANMLDTCLWTHPTERVSLLFHKDDLMLAGKQKNISEVLAELRRDLEIESNEVTTKPTRYLGQPLVKTEERYNFGVDASYVENMLEEFNMTALKSSQTLRWECRETDKQELLAREERVYRQLVGKLLWIDSVHEKCPVNSAIPLWKPWNHDSRPRTLNLEAVKRAPVTYGDSDWASDADRFSVSETASWLRGKLGWYPINASRRKQQW